MNKQVSIRNRTVVGIRPPSSRLRLDSRCVSAVALRSLKPVIRHSSRSLHVLMFGGTGQDHALAARLVARDAGKRFWRVDLGGVVSKYIGETEKNLARLLERAAMPDVVLFFDEADALFGKRTRVGGSRSRVALYKSNSVVGQLSRHAGWLFLSIRDRRLAELLKAQWATKHVDFG